MSVGPPCYSDAAEKIIGAGLAFREPAHDFSNNDLSRPPLVRAPFGMDRWRPTHLLAAWGAWWVGLAAVGLGPAIAAILRVTTPEGAKGSFEAGFGDGMLKLVVKSGESVSYSGQVGFTAAVLWIAGPPLLLWIAWALARPSRNALPPQHPEHGALGAGNLMDRDPDAVRRPPNELRR